MKLKHLPIFGVILFAIVIRIIFFCGYCLGDDPVYFAYANMIADYHYPSFNILNPFAFRPLFLLPIGLSLYLFGRSETALILPVFIASIITVILTYLIAKKLWGYWEGVLSALFLAIFPMDIVHASTLTNDIILSAFISLSFYFFIKSKKEEKGLSFAFWSGLILGLSTQVKINGYIAILILLGWAIYEDLKNKKISKNTIYLFSGCVIAQLLIALFYTIITSNPLMPISSEIFYNHKHLLPGLLNRELSEILLFYPKFLIGFFKEGHANFRFMAYGIHFYVFIVAIVYFLLKRDKNTLFPIFWFFIFFLLMEFLPLKFYPYRPLHRLPRFLIPLFVPLCLIVGLFFYELFSKKKKALTLIMIFVLLIIGIFSIKEAAKKSYFFKDCMRDPKLAANFILKHNFNNIATDIELKACLIFFLPKRNQKILDLDYHKEDISGKTILILGGSRRPELDPAYPVRFFPKRIPYDWRMMFRDNKAKITPWRKRRLTIFMVENKKSLPKLPAPISIAQ